MSSAGISLSILIVLYLSWYVDAACMTQLGKLQVNKGKECSIRYPRYTNCTLSLFGIYSEKGCSIRYLRYTNCALSLLGIYSEKGCLIRYPRYTNCTLSLFGIYSEKGCSIRNLRYTNCTLFLVFHNFDISTKVIFLQNNVCFD